MTQIPPMCRKILELCPPTEDNNQNFYSTWGQRVQNTKSDRVIIPDTGSRLTRCNIGPTEVNESLYIPTGWILSVFTLVGRRFVPSNVYSS